MRHAERRVQHYLGDILQCCERIEKYVYDMQGEDFLVSDMVQDAVVRNFEIIGEASKHLLQRFPEFTAAHPELPLTSAYEMRNFVAHGYQHVDYEIVWTAVTRDVPELARQVKACLDSLPNA